MPKRAGDTEITIPQYIRHHVYSEANGHDIIIVSGDQGNERLMTIKCRWPKDKNPRTKPYTESPLKDEDFNEFRKKGLI